MKLRAAFLFAAISCFTLFAQKPAPAPPQQSAREALLEMITGGSKGVTRHLTVEVQDLLSKNKESAAMLGALEIPRAGEMQTFPTGTTLITMSEPAQHTKVEIDVDSDDLNGDQEVLQLSVHAFRDGKEQPEEVGLVSSSHIAVTMQKQQGIWRLSNIGVGLEFPVGDAEFLKKTFLRTAEAASNAGFTPTPHTELKLEKPAEFDPQGPVMLLAATEAEYAGLHPDIGFTCSMAELRDLGKSFKLEEQLTANNSTYKFSVMGCEGKPTGSFQIVAEPVVEGTGAKAFCTDATKNIRFSEDGRGGTCLASGHFVGSTEIQNSGVAGIGVDLHLDPAKP